MRNFFYLTLAIFFTFSCEKDNVSNNKKKNIQPLEVGYYWTFVDSTFSNDGILSKVDTSTVSVIGKESVNYKGKEIELFYWKWDFYDRIWLYNNVEGSNYCYGLRHFDKNYAVEKSLDFKYPVNTGDTWNVYRYDISKHNDNIYCFVSDTIERECMYTNKTYRTKLGEFNCIVTKYTQHIGDDLREIYLYHCPDIGYVGLKTVLNEVVVGTKQLIDYDLSVRDAVKKAKSTQNVKLDSIFYNSYGIVLE